MAVALALFTPRILYPFAKASEVTKPDTSNTVRIHLRISMSPFFHAGSSEIATPWQPRPVVVLNDTLSKETTTRKSFRLLQGL